MSSGVKVEWVGTDRLIRMLAQGGSQAVGALGRALHQEAEGIFSISQDQVPFADGALHASGTLHQPAISGSQVIVEITYGGNASDYAAIQHENATYRHDPGKKARYLQDPFEDALPGMSDKIADRVEAILKGLI